MTETGKMNTNLTDKERLYEGVCLKTEHDKERYYFPGIDEGAESYFEAVDIQPRLEVYDIKNGAAMEKCLELFMHDELAEIKKECTRAFIKNAVRVEDEKGTAATAQVKSSVPDFIYTF